MFGVFLAVSPLLLPAQGHIAPHTPLLRSINSTYILVGGGLFHGTLKVSDTADIGHQLAPVLDDHIASSHPGLFSRRVLADPGHNAARSDGSIFL